jgi:hypothetical protein
MLLVAALNRGFDFEFESPDFELETLERLNSNPRELFLTCKRRTVFKEKMSYFLLLTGVGVYDFFDFSILRDRSSGTGIKILLPDLRCKCTLCTVQLDIVIVTGC